MISAVSQATEPAAESVPSDSTAPHHWLLGRYYVKTPDLSDETRWEISQGRAWPVFNGLMVLLHDLERRGTEQQQLAAVAGRIEHLGVNGLAESIRMSPTAILRQLRFLERIGIVRTTQATFTVETDPATGRIVRNYAKAPPKVIELTLTDRHYRPTGRAKAAKGDTHETTARRQGDTHETTRTVRNPQGRNECVPRERTSREVRSSGTNRRQDASGPLGRPESPAAKANPGEQRRDITAVVAAFDTNPAIPGSIAKSLGLDPAEVASTPPGEKREELIRRFYASQGWRYDPATNTVIAGVDHYSALTARGEITPAESPHDRASRQRLFAAFVSNCAKSLRLTEAEVIEIGKGSKDELVRRLQDAGCDPATGRRIRHRVTDADRAAAMQRRHDERTGLDVRQAVTAAVSLHDEPQEAPDAFGPADDTSAREEAAAGLRDALATMSPPGRERARDLGEQIDAEADELLKIIEQRRAAAIEAQADSDRQCAELRQEVERQERQFKELRQRLGVGKLRCES